MGAYADRLRRRIGTGGGPPRRDPAPSARPSSAPAAEPADAMSEREFLSRRRMFRADRAERGGPRVAGPGVGGNHRAWMSDLDDFEFRRTTRGYHLDGDLAFYRGGFEPVSIRAVREALPTLVAALGLPPSTRVWTGARERARGALSGLHMLGTGEDVFAAEFAGDGTGVPEGASP